MLNPNGDLCFVVLCPELKFGGIRTTVSTVRDAFPAAPCLCVVPKDADPEDAKTAGGIAPVVRGGQTVSSMINKGLGESRSRWNMVVVAGNAVRYGPVLKYARFVTAETDVLYQVRGQTEWRWDEASIHGLLISRAAFEDVGAFPEDEESIQGCKLLWAGKALERGYSLKGLVGTRLN